MFLQGKIEFFIYNLYNKVIMPSFKEITNSDDFPLELDNSIVLVNFSATWCGPCKVLYPELVKLSEMMSYKDVKFLKVMVDDCDELIEEYKVSNFPTCVIFENKKEIIRTVGTIDTIAILKSRLAVCLSKIQDDTF